MRVRYDAIILAVAGLQRLGMSRIHQVLPADVPHAVGQGPWASNAADDTEVLSLLKAIEHVPTRDRASRAPLRELEGGCQVPIGVNTQLDGATLTGIVISVDGKTSQRYCHWC